MDYFIVYSESGVRKQFCFPALFCMEKFILTTILAGK